MKWMMALLVALAVLMAGCNKPAEEESERASGVTKPEQKTAPVHRGG